MAADFPVDEHNLSFSDEEAARLFITQSTFHNIDTQEAYSAADFFDNLSVDMQFGESLEVQNHDLANIAASIENEDWREHNDVQYFDFSSDVDNGYSVSTQEPFVLTRHHDGAKFVVGDKSLNDMSDEAKRYGENHALPPVYDEQSVETDLKRFGQPVNDDELDANKRKR